MKSWLGFLVFVVGVILDIYVGGWLCLVGGFVQFVDGIKADPTSGTDLLFGFLRFFATIPVVALCLIGFGKLGLKLMDKKKK